jgi:hypothetical protein
VLAAGSCLFLPLLFSGVFIYRQTFGSLISRNGKFENSFSTFSYSNCTTLLYSLPSIPPCRLLPNLVCDIAAFGIACNVLSFSFVYLVATCDLEVIILSCSCTYNFRTCFLFFGSLLAFPPTRIVSAFTTFLFTSL